MWSKLTRKESPAFVHSGAFTCFREPPKSVVLAGFTGGSHFYTKNRITSFLQGTDQRAKDLPGKSPAQRELSAKLTTAD